MANSLLSIKNLTISLKGDSLNKAIVKDVSLEIFPGSIVALVGGSGSGKTTTGLSIMRLLSPALQITEGEIFFDQRNLLNYTDDQMRIMRGKEIGMVFQEPLNAFNPVFTIGYQIEEVLRFHTNLTRLERAQKVLDLLDTVGISEPQRVSKNYPHQLSGGMRQRAMIAQAIAADPKLIIADEPTSNLDVTLQAKIMDLFRKLKEQFGLSILLITHDLGMVGHLSDQIYVMTDGTIVEQGTTETIFNRPVHEYTCQLLETLKL